MLSPTAISLGLPISHERGAGAVRHRLILTISDRSTSSCWPQVPRCAVGSVSLLRIGICRCASPTFAGGVFQVVHGLLERSRRRRHSCLPLLTEALESGIGKRHMIQQPANEHGRRVIALLAICRRLHLFTQRRTSFLRKSKIHRGKRAQARPGGSRRQWTFPRATVAGCRRLGDVSGPLRSPAEARRVPRSWPRRRNRGY